MQAYGELIHTIGTRQELKPLDGFTGDLIEELLDAEHVEDAEVLGNNEEVIFYDFYAKEKGKEYNDAATTISNKIIYGAALKIRKEFEP